MAGFGLGSNPNVVDPFNNPSYVSSSEGGHHQRYSYQSSGLSGENMASPRSGAGSLSSDKTTRGRAPSPPGQYQQMTRGVPLSVVVEHGGSDVRLDGASDIMSTFGSAFGDRPESIRSTATSYNEHHYNAAAADQAQIARYHALSDVEEVLTPVADERLSLRPGQSLPWRSTSTYNSRSRGGSVSSPPRPLQETASSSPSSPQFDHPLRQPPVDPLSTDTTTTTTEFRNPFASDENVEVQQRSLSPPPRHHQQSHHQHHPSLSLYRQHHQHHASDADLANAAAMIPPVPPSGVRGRRTPGPGAYRRKSEATSLSGILPSDVSVAASGTGTSIVERPPSLDTSEWDDLALRRQQEERLFFSASVESAVRSDSK
ncbi:hypothetical protein FRC17_004394 [Serendipita sp. 399]|nr:hypothetical protein FRC17_004394 [Serendipita sp. 399]